MPTLSGSGQRLLGGSCTWYIELAMVLNSGYTLEPPGGLLINSAVWDPTQTN